MYNGERLIERPLRWGMGGNGRKGRVGYKHRTGAQRDGTYKLVCGAFDLDTNRGRGFGINIGVDSDRCYCAKRRGDEAFLKIHRYPDIKAGTEGVRWLENCVRSADAGSAWIHFK